MPLTYDEKIIDPELKDQIDKYNDAIDVMKMAAKLEITSDKHHTPASIIIEAYKENARALSCALRSLIAVDTVGDIEDSLSKAKKQWRDTRHEEILKEYLQVQSYAATAKERFNNFLSAKDVALIDQVILLCKALIEKRKKFIQNLVPRKKSLPKEEELPKTTYAASALSGSPSIRRDQNDNVCIRVLRALGCW